MILDMNKIERLIPNSDLLSTFLIVVECENITHASDVLGRTQSAISVQISKLEDLLAVRLFDRQSRGMKLTDDGLKLLPVAEAVVAELKKIPLLFEEPLQGSIRVGIPDDYTETILETILMDFSKRHADVQIFARSGCTSTFPEAIKKNELDIAVHSSLFSKDGDFFSSEPNIWVASKNFTFDRQDPVPLAILDRSCEWRSLPTKALNEVGRKWFQAYSSENFASLKAAVRSGLAVGVIPKSAKCASLKELSGKDGFPKLPPSNRRFLINDKARPELVEAMVDALKSAANPSAHWAG